MEIYSKNKYPANALSNFAVHPFEFDGIQIQSMEGFLQGLKFQSPEMQEHICTLGGGGAKRAGSKKNWKTKQTLYWKGQPVHRSSDGYTNLVANAYTAMLMQSESFRRALEAAGNANFTHSMGSKNKSETVLTRTEFCANLHRLQKLLKESK